MTIDVERYSREFPSLTFGEPEPGILQLVIKNPARLNAADERMHRDLVYNLIDCSNREHCNTRGHLQ